MSEIQVTTATLISKAEELTQLNEQFKKAVESLKQEEQALRTSYEGESSDAFHAAFTKDSIQMDNFYNAIAQYAQKLLQIAESYEKTEQANISIVSN